MLDIAGLRIFKVTMLIKKDWTLTWTSKLSVHMDVQVYLEKIVVMRL
jgi:hypothetical protein